jgi:hypothetical protein
MPSTPLTYLEMFSTQESIQHANTQGDNNIGLSPSWASGLDLLKNVCDHAASLDRQQRQSVIQACQQIARLVGEAGFCNLQLPRDYEVRRIDRHWLLVKCLPPLGSTSGDSSGLREVRFVASGEESLWTRFDLQVTALTDSQVSEVVIDLESGLINEIIEWVQKRTAMVPVCTLPPTTVASTNSSTSAPNGANRLRLVDLGRAKNRPIRQDVHEVVRHTT